jgi:putative transposase
MGSVGDAYDNAMCESFFATLECELLDRRKFQTKAEAPASFCPWLQIPHQLRKEREATARIC